MTFEHVSEPSRIAVPSDLSLVSGEKMPDTLLELSASKDCSLSELLEWCVAASTKAMGSDYAATAFREFKDKTGVIHHDDWFFHQRSNYFLNYFLFEHVVESGEPTAFESLNSNIWSFQKSLNSDQQKKLNALSSFQHSVYQIIKNTDNNMIVKDLINKNKIEVMSGSTHSFEFLQKGAVFQGYLVPFGEKLVLSDGVVFHSLRVYKLIKKALKKSIFVEKEQKISFLFQLAKIQLQSVRNSRVEEREFYKKLLS